MQFQTPRSIGLCQLKIHRKNVPRKDKEREVNTMRKGMSEKKLTELINKYGFTTKQLEEMLQAKKLRAKKVVEPRTASVFRFAIIGDTHLIDKGCALDELHDFYAKAKAYGAKYVLHSGDLMAGQGVFKSQMNDNLVHGFDAHVSYVVKNYPKVEGLTTFVIHGNHDSSYVEQFGADALKLVSAKREDIVLVGTYQAMVVLNGVRFMLQHGARGAPYALSYAIQRYITNLPAGQKPQIYNLGH